MDAAELQRMSKWKDEADRNEHAREVFRTFVESMTPLKWSLLAALVLGIAFVLLLRWRKEAFPDWVRWALGAKRTIKHRRYLRPRITRLSPGGLWTRTSSGAKTKA